MAVGCFFRSDSIPMHLLTAECAEIYRRRLAPGGVLALHISNRALDLDPVARGMAAHIWDGRLCRSPPQDDPRHRREQVSALGSSNLEPGLSKTGRFSA